MKKFILIAMLFFVFSVLAKENKTAQWSNEDGPLEWGKAKEKCESLKMRLPTKDDLIAAQKAGLWKKWLNESTHRTLSYWLSEEGSNNLYAYSVFIEEDSDVASYGTYDKNEVSRVYVRCIAGSPLIYKKIVVSGSDKWSEYQGEMNWNNAKAKCDNLKMRLPTRAEFQAAYKAKITESWEMYGLLINILMVTCIF